MHFYNWNGCVTIGYQCLTYICYLNDIQDSFMNVLDGRLGVDRTAPSGFHLVEEAEFKIELPCNVWSVLCEIWAISQKDYSIYQEITEF